MSARFRIQILDESSYVIKYFDRMKSSYGGHRVITTISGGKIFPSHESAEAEISQIQKYYTEKCVFEVVEMDDGEKLDVELPF